MADRSAQTGTARGFPVHWLLIGGLAVAAVLVFALPLQRSRASAAQRDSYVVRDRVVFLDLHADRIGLTLHEGSSRAGLPPAQAADAVHLETRRHRLHVFDPEGTPDRDGLTLLARSFLRGGAQVVKRAGMLATPAGAREPVLVTHEFSVRFRDGASDERIGALLRRHGVEVVRRSRHVPGLWLLATPAESRLDALEACRLFHGDPLVEYAEPNLVHHVEYLSTRPDDPLFPVQWHHENTGQGGGTVDADIDTPEAWDITLGDPHVVIAVLEDGFDAEHPDLVENLWSDPEDPAVHGWDFEGDDAVLTGDPADRGAAAHGTAVAGCAAARGDNGIGVSGSCPRCRLMLLRRSMDHFMDGEAIQHAWRNGADILTNSWTYGEFAPIPETVRAAIEDAVTHGRDGKGCVVLFALRNSDMDVTQVHDIAALPGVIAVGSVTNTDQRTTTCGSGPCVAVLGPSRLSQTHNFTEGTLNVATTDWRGPPNGYNADPALQVPMDDGWDPCDEAVATPDYTLCFGGTSAATPIVAGVAGLVLSVAPELTAVEVRRLLQDTCDRVEDSRAAYSAVDGYSTLHTHGNGRVNAFEAVRVVAPAARGGRGGVDVFVRDQRLDWGNTEQPSSVLFERVRGVAPPGQSPDVKIDAPPYASAPATAAGFEAFVDEAPLQGATNRVYVRVRNRGPATAASVSVRVAWAWSTLHEGRLPADIAALAAVEGAWHPLPPEVLATVPYSGPSVAGGAEDAACCATFELALPDVEKPAELDLLAVVDCAQDPLSAASRAGGALDERVARDNNLALRTVTAVAPAGGG